MPLKRMWIGFVLAAAAVSGLLVAADWLHRHSRPNVSAEQLADQQAASQASGPLPSLWPAPAFSYLDQNRRALSDRDLRGHVWVADFFFTGCTTICPMMTAAMSQLAAAISNPRVEFVSFSIDPEHDTPEVLLAYSKMWKADAARWHFLATDRAGIAATAAAMKTFVQPPTKDSPIQHSAVFLLVDQKGIVRGVYDSSDSVALRRLAVDALTLAGTPPATAPAVQAQWPLPRSRGSAGSRGEALYVRSGCLACHAQSHVAPSLEGRFGGMANLSDGSAVKVDDAYLRESILDPNARVVAGYPALMPSYRGQLTDSQVDELVEYVASLDGAPAGQRLAAAPQKEVVDPVCGMEIEAGPGNLHAEYQGKTYFFCGESCRSRFLKNPEAYRSQKSGS